MGKLAIVALLALTISGCSALEKACVGQLVRPVVPVVPAPIPQPVAMAYLPEK